MRFPRAKRSTFEGLVYVQTIDEDGRVSGCFEREEDVRARLAPKCGSCCHPERTSVVVLGRVRDGVLVKENGERVQLERFGYAFEEEDGA